MNMDKQFEEENNQSEFKSYDGHLVNQSEIDNQSEILFDVKQCEELFQRDKSQKLHSDIENIKTEMIISKQKELNFYQNLNLPNDIKKQIFGVNSQPVQKIQKVFVWDPVKGALIMTEQEYINEYEKKQKE